MSIQINSFPAIVLNLLKDIFERSRKPFNKFRASAEDKNRADSGFTLVEVMLAMMIAGMVLAPIFLMYGTILQRVNKSVRGYEMLLLCTNFLHEARQKQEPAVQDFSLEKKEIDFDATLTYSLGKGVPQGSSLTSLSGLHQEVVTIAWQENGQKKQDQLIAFVYKKPEQKKK